MSDYYPNGRPKWDDQFRETSWERQERWRKARLRARDTDGSPKGTDPKGLDGEAATAGAAESGIAQRPPA